MNKQIKQETGYIYIFDLEEKNTLSAILLHDIPFKVGEECDLQKVSLVRLKTVKSMFKKQLLSIEIALKNCEMIHAEIAFKNLVLADDDYTGIPNTYAELMRIDHLTVKYRG